MNPEFDIPCALNPLLDCEEECELYKRNSQFVEEFAQGLEVPENRVVEKLRSEFLTQTLKEQGKIIMSKINILEEKNMKPQNCLKFLP